MSYFVFSCFSEEYLQMGLCTGNNTFEMEKNKTILGLIRSTSQNNDLCYVQITDKARSKKKTSAKSNFKYLSGGFMEISDYQSDGQRFQQNEQKNNATDVVTQNIHFFDKCPLKKTATMNGGKSSNI